ncbi:MAG: hypothetical protein VXZ82_13330 [Planctomycetota bacterium]|nr:hypothetical protein [Planctomycetota bacterium]
MPNASKEAEQVFAATAINHRDRYVHHKSGSITMVIGTASHEMELAQWSLAKYWMDQAASTSSAHIEASHGKK